MPFPILLPLPPLAEGALSDRFFSQKTKTKTKIQNTKTETNTKEKRQNNIYYKQYTKYKIQIQR